MDLLPVKVLRQLLSTGFSFVHRTLRFVTQQPALLWPVNETLPVAGLDAALVQELVFALHKAADDDTSILFLLATQLSQICSDRLLHDLNYVERTLQFWEAQLQLGPAAHLQFMLLSRGPASFVRSVTDALLPHDQRASASATDKMLNRVLYLKGLRSRIATALSAVHNAAGLLLLDGLPLQPVAPVGVDPGSEEEQQQRQEASMLVQAARSATWQVVLALEGVLDELDHAARGMVASDSRAVLKPSSMAAAADDLPGPLGTAARPRLLQGDASRDTAALRSALIALADRLGFTHKRGAPHPDLHSQPLQLQQQQQHGTDDHHSHSHASLQPPQRAEPSSGLVRRSGGSVNCKRAMDAARRAAALSGPLVRVPRWAKRPSRLERHWLRYSLAGAATLYCGGFLYRHSSLAGSDDLRRWSRGALDAVQTAFDDHVAAPLLALRDELFATFRDRPGVVSLAEFEADKASLLRMLEDFEEDGVKAGTLPRSGGGRGGGSNAWASGNSSGSSSSTSTSGTSTSLVPSQASNHAPGTAPADALTSDEALAKGMQVVMASYESELRSPLRNLMMGQLARSLLIQVQRLKVDTEAAMLQLDQILRANELSISLVAAVPAIALSWAALMGLIRLLRPRAPDTKREAVPCRLAMLDLEKALLALRDQNTQQQQLLPGAVTGQRAAGSFSRQASLAVRGGVGGAGGSVASEVHGMCVYQTYRVHKEAVKLFRRADRTSRYSEWPPLQRDLLALSRWRCGGGAEGAAGFGGAAGLGVAALSSAAGGGGSGMEAAEAAAHLAVHERMMRSYKVFQR